MNHQFPYRLYLVVAEENCGGKNMPDLVEQAVLGGVDIVQLREKKIAAAEFIQRALQLQEVLAKYNVPLIINDNLDVAKQVDAFGIHVGNSDLPPTQIKSLWSNCQSIGYSIEYLEQLETQESHVADYLGISPVFATPTKTNTVTQWGLDGIQTIRSLTTKPLVAIGNMNTGNAYNVIKAGADCIAVVSAICGAPDSLKAAHEIRTQIEKAL